MHIMHIKKSRVLMIILISGAIIISAVYYFIFTAAGSTFIAKKALKGYAGAREIDIRETNGALSEKLIFKDIEITNLKWLPAGSIIKIQKFEAEVNSFSLKGVYVDIFNARLLIPGTDIILFSGTHQDGELDFNIYSSMVDFRQVFDLFVKNNMLKKISSQISEFDVYIKGRIFSPELSGSFYVQKFSRNGFSLSDSKGTIDLKIRGEVDDFNVTGTIFLSGGVVSGYKTAIIKLDNGKIMFSGDPKNPLFDVKGSAKVADTKIDISLKGTLSKPELKLSSDPSRPQEHLLIMLATGKSWEGLDKPLGKGEIPADIANDFMDYFIFSGTGSKIAEKYGITDISLSLERGRAGAEVRKAITENIEAGYGIEQSQKDAGAKDATHKITGEYKVTESISAGLEREIKQNGKTDKEKEATQTDDKVLLKYKKGF